MKKSSDVDSIFNDGERLVPFLSHNHDELIRHFSSHSFFKKIILKDIANLNLKDISVLDLGFGTGYASFAYANIDQVEIVKSIDVTRDSLEWAKDNYSSKKIEYEICDAVKFLKNKETYSYVVTRHVLEHIEDGLNILTEEKFINRLCINVPYNEAKGNIYHLLTGITEKDFPMYKNREFFYEDLKGVTYSKIPKGIRINSVICIASKGNMPKVGSYFKFPLRAITVEEVFNELSHNNFKFVKNMLDVQMRRALKLNIVESENKTLRDSMQKAEVLEREVGGLRRQLDAIYRSKRWKLVTKMANAKSKILK